MEGISQEAASIAGHFGLGKLIVCYDDNRITIDGSTAISFDGENHVARLAADGWHVQRVADSEDVEALTAALSAAREEPERPSFIAIRSHIAYPAPHAVDTAKAHGAPLGEEEVRAAKVAMGFQDPERTFWVDESVYAHMSIVDAGAREQARWQERLHAWRTALPELAADWELALNGSGLREGWREALPSFKAGEEIATRAAGQKVMAAFADLAPTMIGGAADLVESTKTVFEGAGEFSRPHAGRNVPFGIREHAMGAIVNGAAAHGGIVKPYGSTFLVFSDYMRATVRLSALMGLPVVWVWTHDSVGLGEDGPTHQPVEHYAALRAIPKLWVIRPADANETAQAWRVALGTRGRAGGFAALPAGHPRARPGRRGARAGHRLGAGRLRAVGLRRPASAPELILISTGAEVPLTLEAGTDARSARARGCGSCRCRAWSCSKPSRSPTASRCCPRRIRPPRRRAGREPELVALGRRSRLGPRDRPFRRLGAGRQGPRGARVHRREHRRARPCVAEGGRLMDKTAAATVGVRAERVDRLALARTRSAAGTCRA